MNKQEIEQIRILVKLDGKETLHMNIYKNGILYRQGCRSVPEIGITAKSFTENTIIFDKLMSVVPQQILDNPINYKDEKINSALEYTITFYGVSKNGETGENAEWTKSTGINLIFDANTSSQQAIVAFADTFSLEAIEQTNSWYFDVIINAVYKLRSSSLPETQITVANAPKDIPTDFKNYVHQIRNSARKWDITTFANDKTYLDSNNNKFAPFVVQTDDSFSIRFIPIIEKSTGNKTPNDTKVKWW